MSMIGDETGALLVIYRNGGRAVREPNYIQRNAEITISGC